ncbi:MAG: biotin--[acetyl-CoA-carboxylase] ligase [Burkholderiales bacterium]
MNGLSFALLRALSDGDFHSGSALARGLEVTRGTIWNAVRSLEQIGLDVYRVRGRGYRLCEPVSLLDRDVVLRHAGEQAGRFRLEISDLVDSTNTRLMSLAQAGAPGGTVIAAELQQSGRGRMGRTWHSAIGGALTFSLLWRFREGAGALAGLSLAAGVALSRSLAKLGAPVQLKWPNDLVCRGAKLGGILIEMQGDALGPSAAIIGIGINIRLAPAARAKIDQPAIDLASVCSGPIDRSRVLGHVLAELARVLERFATEGFGPFKSEWAASHAHQGREIALVLPTGRVEHGIARGVADDGSLIFEGAGGIRRVHSGEVSVRTPRAPAGAVPRAGAQRRA